MWLCSRAAAQPHDKIWYEEIRAMTLLWKGKRQHNLSLCGGEETSWKLIIFNSSAVKNKKKWFLFLFLGNGYRTRMLYVNWCTRRKHSNLGAMSYFWFQQKCHHFHVMILELLSAQKQALVNDMFQKHFFWMSVFAQLCIPHNVHATIIWSWSIWHAAISPTFLICV